MSEPLAVVTIDGPSGVGKSTISRRVAARLGFTYLDTGAMYRAVALRCRQENLAITNEKAVAAILPLLNIRLLPARSEQEETRVILDGVEVSEEIRTPEISMLASAVSALGPVRSALTRMQREMGATGKIVAEGRDTGTVVFPGAAWKIYLDASPEVRAKRRIRQLRERGEEVNEAEILAQIVKRDRDDSERTIAPLKAAPDAVRIDSTGMSVDEVVEQVLGVVQQQQKAG
ncbi:MAG: (d)CMP kinase [Desulfobulbus sp.]|jgi:cytidylate kinase|nr:MAG: (d)CMP kinase [Desulfobulbus sp.]